MCVVERDQTNMMFLVCVVGGWVDVCVVACVVYTVHTSLMVRP